VLTKHDVERINQTGVPFDVDLHDAMMRQKAEDGSVESGTVLQVIENGYRMGDKTLRHAKVIVSE
jgi:molecular chaperone GrpE